MDSNEQTEAVFKSSRTEVDPVSGNEVPPGALPEEVRDDIDAKLSEGEYVVPADVLRYYGLKFFEDLRDKAKKKMEDLDEGGRIGGEPVMEEPQADMEEDLPFDIRELQVVEAPDEPEMGMADGGLVKGYADGGDVTQMAIPDFMGGSPTSTVVGTDEYKTYKNDAGMIITVRFVDGKPMSYIPPGYTEQAAATAEVDSTASQVRSDYEQSDGDGVYGKDDTSNNISDTDSTSSNGEMPSYGGGLGGFGAGLLGGALGFGIMGPSGAAGGARVGGQAGDFNAARNDLVDAMASYDQEAIDKAKEDITKTYEDLGGLARTSVFGEGSSAQEAIENVQEAVREAREQQAQASAQASLERARERASSDNRTSAAEEAREAAARNEAAGMGAQTKEGSMAGTKSGYF